MLRRWRQHGASWLTVHRRMRLLFCITYIPGLATRACVILETLNKSQEACSLRYSAVPLSPPSASSGCKTEAWCLGRRKRTGEGARRTRGPVVRRRAARHGHCGCRLWSELYYSKSKVVVLVLLLRKCGMLINSEVVAMLRLQQTMRWVLRKIKSGYCRNCARAESKSAYSKETQRTSEDEAGGMRNREETARPAGQVR